MLFVLLAMLGNTLGLAAQSLQTLHSFDTVGGYRPEQGVVLNGDWLFGTTSYGGTNATGVLFKIRTDGTGFTVLHDSATSDWFYPQKVTVSRNVIYGTTSNGGTTSFGDGAIFKINTDGTGYSVLKVFTEGEGPNVNGGLVLSGDTLFGSARYGEDGSGVIFKINTNVAETLLSFTAFQPGARQIQKEYNPSVHP